MLGMIFTGIVDVVKGWFALRAARQVTQLQLHQQFQERQYMDGYALQYAQLLSFKGSNLLREESFWLVAIPIAASAIFPNFAHNCAQNVVYAIPEKMLWLMGSMIAAIFGLGKWSDAKGMSR